MNAKDVRIGNWVMLDEGQHQIDYKDIYHMEVEGGGYRYEGIELTPMILLKCEGGYPHRFSATFCFDEDQIDLEFGMDGKEPTVYFRLNAIDTFTYLHDFQNLYYYLTRKELKIKL